jgi:hypothetical protein
VSRQEDVAWWNRVRRMGFWRFVLIYGVIYFGGISFVFWMCAYYYGLVGARYGVLGMLSWFALGGWISGGLIWMTNEFIHRKLG